MKRRVGSRSDLYASESENAHSVVQRLIDRHGINQTAGHCPREEQRTREGVGCWERLGPQFGLRGGLPVVQRGSHLVGERQDDDQKFAQR